MSKTSRVFEWLRGHPGVKVKGQPPNHLGCFYSPYTTYIKADENWKKNPIHIYIKGTTVEKKEHSLLNYLLYQNKNKGLPYFINLRKISFQGWL